MPHRPTVSARHHERHPGGRTGWLRAAVLGANDGIVSTASLLVGVATASTGLEPVLVAGVAGLVAGAMSMAAGEYVSVKSQADADAADLARERAELAADEGAELRELASIYVQRGLDPQLAQRVAIQLTDKDALEAHARDELGITSRAAARPIQAAGASAASFAAGAALPLVTAVLAPLAYIAQSVAASSLLFLAALGGLAARAGGAPMGIGAARVAFWGAAAMAITAAVGALFGTAVG